MTKIACPFVYARGKRCTGHIVRVEAFKADLIWTEERETGAWKFSCGAPRSHYHLFCSEKDNHAGYQGQDSDQMKFFFSDLPEEVRKAINT